MHLFATWRRFAVAAALAALLLLLPALALAAEAEAVITGNLVNLRSGPALGFSRVAYLNKGDRVTVTDEENGWYAVDSAKGSGYVYGAYASLSDEGPQDNAADEPDGNAQDTSTALLRRGSTGGAVKQLQGNLIMLGYLNSRADGVFGPATETAVRRYQSRNALTSDGVAGPRTVSAIGSEVLRVLKVVDTAKRYLGLAYTYGGTSPETGFDCSGLTQYAFGAAGISIPRVSYEQATAGLRVPTSQLRAGDLVAFYSPVSHVGIYVGGGKFIHSPKTGDVVKLTNLSAMPVTAIRRLTGKLAG